MKGYPTSLDCVVGYLGQVYKISARGIVRTQFLCYYYLGRVPRCLYLKNMHLDAYQVCTELWALAMESQSNGRLILDA